MGGFTLKSIRKEIKWQQRLLKATTIASLLALVLGGSGSGWWLERVGAQSPAVGKIDDFTAKPIADGSKGSYDLKFEMSPEGKFTAEAKITVENRSKDEWDQLIFYFLPNAFTKENKPPFFEDAAEVKIRDVKLDGVKVKYQLTGDTLAIPLAEKLAPNENREVTVKYAFTVPRKGLRFDRTENGFHLAQAYPMLATYQGKDGWNKKPYSLRGESYHTSHADFSISYRLPKGYTVISSSDQDKPSNNQSGEIKVKNTKEVFIAVVKGMRSISKTVKGVELRVWGKEADKEAMIVALQAAEKSFEQFTEKLGPYPHKQLDILLDETASMEYPGVVTVGHMGSVDPDLSHTVVHEIAHQWFYGVVSNDPFHHAWLDEGITELATTLYFYDVEKKGDASFYFAEQADATQSVSNLPLDEFGKGPIVGPVYGQPVKELWKLITTYGDATDGWEFLQAYYQTYAYKQVDTPEFVRFATAYFPVNEQYFAKWLRL